MFDPRRGGVQVLKDGNNNVEITTELVKIPGGMNGGSWAARIKGKPMDSRAFCFPRSLTCLCTYPDRSRWGHLTVYPSRVSAIFYAGLDGLGGIDMVTDEDENVGTIDARNPSLEHLSFVGCRRIRRICRFHSRSRRFHHPHSGRSDMPPFSESSDADPGMY